MSDILILFRYDFFTHLKDNHCSIDNYLRKYFLLSCWF